MGLEYREAYKVGKVMRELARDEIGSGIVDSLSSNHTDVSALRDDNKPCQRFVVHGENGLRLSQ